MHSGIPRFPVRRIAGVFALAAGILITMASAATAADDVPAAVVVDAEGVVVAETDDRSEASELLDTAFAAHRGDVHLEYVYQSHGSDIPNDPLLPLQWNFARIGADEALRIARGDGATVAVLDSPVNFGGVDGFCGPIIAPYNAQTDTPGFSALNTSAVFGHGTHVAGTIGQCTDNGVGVAGVAPGAALIPIQVLNEAGTGTSSDLVRGIDWAIANDADVINMSLGGPCFTTWPLCGDFTVDAAIDRAISAGILLVASTGNDASDLLAYPANHPAVVSVGATTSADGLWRPTAGVGSNTGTGLDLVAPGDGVLQETTRFGVYGYRDGFGTSMAAPHVAGAIALMLQVDPDLTPGDIVNVLAENAVDLGDPGYDEVFGHGRLDVLASVQAVVRSSSPCSDSDRCDSIATVDGGALWGVWSQLAAPPTVASLSSSVTTFYYGNPGDVPFMGDWDGDGTKTPGLYRQSDGYVYLRNSNTQGIADIRYFFGNPGDLPIAGDFDGDGYDTVSIYRPSNQTFYIINELGEDEGGLGQADLSYVFGNPGDKPFVGDFDGDGVDTVGLHRESTGLVYFRNTHTQGIADSQFIYGDPGDLLLAGDWDGNGIDTVAVYRPSTSRIYVNLRNADGVADWIGYVGAVPWVVTAGPQ